MIGDESGTFTNWDSVCYPKYLPPGQMAPAVTRECLVMLARLSSALARARAIPLAA